MARIQILELPMEHVGEYLKTPFAIIIDQATGEERTSIAAAPALLDRFVTESGAVTALVTEITLDI